MAPEREVRVSESAEGIHTKALLGGRDGLGTWQGPESGLYMLRAVPHPQLAKHQGPPLCNGEAVHSANSLLGSRCLVRVSNQDAARLTLLPARGTSSRETSPHWA